MNNPHFPKIAQELNITEHQVAATALLLDEGATIPFIARYRKEATGSLNEVVIAQIRDRLTQLRDLDKRREAILKSIEEQGKLTPELKKKIEAAETMTALEDLYLPYKPKKRTRATIAREKGLEPLGEKIFAQEDFDLIAEAKKFIDPEKGVNTEEEALAGARDIIAEKVNEDVEARATMRDLFWKKGAYTVKVIPGKEEEAKKYMDYFDWEEAVQDAPSHRVLAIRRGEKEGMLSLDTSPEEEEALQKLARRFVKEDSSAENTEQMELAVKDAYKRLLKSSMETEVRLKAKKKADSEAIQVFADNLRELLLAAPLGQKAVLAIDPGFRTGCKVVCLDPQGKLLKHDVIFPDRRRTEAMATIHDLCKKYDVQAIAIGNGTASRETEAFIRSIGLPKEILVVMVNESGASIYSASEVAREEFPDEDITVRGSVSIGRRLMDPLAELVKLDPKSIGVGQYQHDVDQTALKKSLDDVVESSVNKVGVEVNTASKQLLTYVSGLGPVLAQNIIEYRNENGAFKSRAELKKVKRLGNKAFEQAAGFLRIGDAPNPLDASAVHPESYPVVEQMAKDLGCSVTDLMKDDKLRQQIDPKKYVTDTVGLPTLNDILQELAKPGRDPRAKFEVVEFAEGVNTIEDLKTGMKLNGVVTNVTKFGAFVDIGVHQDGLVHISELSNTFVSDPNEVVKVQQKVEVMVLDVDVERKRIQLTMKGEAGAADTAKRRNNKDRKNKPQNRRKDGAGNKPKGKKEEEVPEGDFNSKLAALKAKFGK
ncbi:Tex family protein [uncultured Microscilla sp.]|uniref:Tex family protein n=1 Tax=uncultured Microscilla sp. TaxID=432653 RepID=UPI00261B7466|nr:Tex family protein [uncultured Microscilla sp.]